ncbi:sensor histidine kinase [Nocardiopsis kunsanensis]|uniref:histidine kinase n=1 Tax=Nocardiopsis kunsanensis TaxID=141693 RepID=A0A918X9E9_9ACTN|nr:histidine kinase [Nocardiopsis kunsanensis]GHD19274.1 hypothetical protein GCM10007147_10330 [Nocardiopsis kunsanensis]
MPTTSPRPLMDRVTRWARGHTLAVDVCGAVLWFTVSVSLWPLTYFSAVDSLLYVLLAAACCSALAVRRLRPLASLSALAALVTLQYLWMSQLTVLSLVCALVAAYTSQTELSPRWRPVAVVLLLAGAAWAVFIIPDWTGGDDLGSRMATVASSWSFLLLFTLLGTVRRRNREEVERVVEHARLLEEGRDREVRLAALAERTRIAREMHDVLAHSLNVMIAQADGGRYAAASDPGRAVDALETVGRVGRESARELHQLLGVLRADEERGPAPVPGVAALPELFDEYRSAGLDVRHVLRGVPPGDGGAEGADHVPTSVSLTVHRIVREALANVLKHAGPVVVRVELAWSPHRVDVIVANLPGDGGGEDAPAGHGLAGMRERVALHEGTLEAGPDEGTGGWRVHATLHWGRP